MEPSRAALSQGLRLENWRNSPACMMYTAQQFACLIPTKDRPEQLRKLLASLAQQHFQFGQIVVVASGMDVSAVCQEFPELPIDYEHLSVSGQIFQRSYGLRKIQPAIQLVCLFDDDIVLHRQAMLHMLEAWNKRRDYGAISFNIVNESPFALNIFKYLFLMTGAKAGIVTKAGYNTKITHVAEDLETQWVMGGATVWKKDILLQNPHPSENETYAFNEDLCYCSALGGKYPFAVSAKAHVEHHHVSRAFKGTVSFGELQIQSRMKLVRRYSYFSLAQAHWASVGQTLENLFRALRSREPAYLHVAWGNMKALSKELTSLQNLRRKKYV